MPILNTEKSFAGLPERKQKPPQAPQSVLDERRLHSREMRQAEVTLEGSGCPDVPRCSIRNISEGGMYLLIPASHRPAVGQRYEVRPADDASGRSMRIDQSWSATVIRTEPATSPGGEFIGAGLRFDQPIFL